MDILIVNCSLFNPTPSLAAMIINHFKMRSNIISYNLSGMGCSAGVISIALAQELLQVSQGRNFYLVIWDFYLFVWELSNGFGQNNL